MACMGLVHNYAGLMTAVSMLLPLQPSQLTSDSVGGSA